jgi:hypothetical protein
MAVLRVEDAVECIRMDYAEMPGLHLTFWQAQRLWNLSPEVCDRALSLLIVSGFLVRSRDGCYRRRHPERLNAEPIQRSA